MMSNNLNKQEIKYLRYWIQIFSIVIIAGGLLSVFVSLAKRTIHPSPTWSEALEQYVGKPAYKSVDPNKPWQDQKNIVEIAGRTFEIPTVYIDSNLGGKREQPEGIILIYVLPEFTSRVDFQDRQKYNAAFKQQRFAHMLIEPKSARPSLSIQVENLRKNMLAKETFIGKSDGLEKFLWYLGSPSGPKLWAETYLEKNTKGEIVSFIQCSSTEQISVRFPGCSHKFMDKGFIYDLYYNQKNYFPTWREQRRKAVEFINNFEIKPEPSINKEN